MKRSLLMFAAAALLATSAMAHGPPSQPISKDVAASTGIVHKAPSGTSSMIINHDLASATTSVHDGGSGGITSVNGFTRPTAGVVAGITMVRSDVAHQTIPPNERMLN